eukprot:CAMPEP_0182932502 /NCGR_PEP_ID=MMETSP0105_2-20130417/31484_1 /TAXON_ID=81532 ORGANISM="Acanthoeca-like sp., Strain 10tr" /NCGR_SAMPLE_ID=MMETSP0105_2 /ASSEMBLY_ACC=CAM_ASM_000205 /LENGTH=212 /DNA_ID=CAMNT_0025071107 /DNA_START=65 /DNA_END=699 /DNA_ORIENTATION=-
MAAAATKTIFCHICEETHSVAQDILTCPSCGDEFIEEIEEGDGGAPGPAVGPDAAGAQQHPLLMLLSRLVELRAQVADVGEAGDVGPLLEMLHNLPHAAGGGYGGQPAGDFADDARFEELLQQFLDDDDSQKRAPPASEAVIGKLMASAIKMSETEMAAGTPCSVCQSKIAPDATVLLLQCGHPYHPDCLLPWLKQTSTCPVCRWDVNTSTP